MRSVDLSLAGPLLEILRHFVSFVRLRERWLIETHSLPSSFSASRRGFAFCLADPIGSAAERLFVELIVGMDERGHGVRSGYILASG